MIIPVYQDHDGIGACLRGLELQSIPPDQFEVIVVDNGSKPAIVAPESNLQCLTVLQCATPGSYAARNMGVRASRGVYLAFTDADCVPEENWIRNGISALESATPGTVVGGEIRLERPPRKTAVSLYQTSAGSLQAQNVARKGFAATACMFCSRSTFDRVGPFSEALLSGGDLEWGLRARTVGTVVTFAPGVVVRTAPRTTLAGAIRQARRVTGGRYHLKRAGIAAASPDLLQPNRGVFASLLWTMRHPDLGPVDRVRVLGVAAVIKFATVLEAIRIRLGGRAERR